MGRVPAEAEVIGENFTKREEFVWAWESPQRKGRRVSQKPAHEGQRRGSWKKEGACETGTLEI